MLSVRYEQRDFSCVIQITFACNAVNIKILLQLQRACVTDTRNPSTMFVVLKWRNYIRTY